MYMPFQPWYLKRRPIETEHLRWGAQPCFATKKNATLLSLQAADRPSHSVQHLAAVLCLLAIDILGILSTHSLQGLCTKGMQALLLTSVGKHIRLNDLYSLLFDCCCRKSLQGGSGDRHGALEVHERQECETAELDPKDKKKHKRRLRDKKRKKSENAIDLASIMGQQQPMKSVSQLRQERLKREQEEHQRARDLLESSRSRDEQ